MKLKVFFAFVLFVISGYVFVSCEKSDISSNTRKSYFLSDIRPVFFENLNFDSPEVIKNMPSFKENFLITFNNLEEEYDQGKFISTSDVEFFRLACQYYSFYLLGLTGAQLDGYITVKDIVGNRNKGTYSKLDVNVVDFEYLEMQAMITKAKEVAYKAAYLQGKYNDKAYGFYLGCYQIEQRVKSRNNLNNPAVNKLVLNFTKVELTNYNLLPVWNLLMAQVTLTNYNDPSNTFDNPLMDTLFANAQTRLIPGSLADLGGKYPEILGPLYRFDLTMKKIDWYLQKNSLDSQQHVYINSYLNDMKNAMDFIENKQKKLFNTWTIKDTYFERKQKWNELRVYFNNTARSKKPELKSFISSKNFIKAYQCYSCHRNSGL